MILKKGYRPYSNKKKKLGLLAVCLLLGCSTVSLFIPQVSSSRLRDSWANIEVFSFDGENILLDLKISVVGNHAEEIMLVRDTPPVDGGLEVWADVADVVFNDGTNITIFSYYYAYNYTNYNATPKSFGYLVFPWDEHRLVLYIVPQFELDIDPKPTICYLPSQNYEGKFSVLQQTPTSKHPFIYKLDLDIKHSPSFVIAVSCMVWIPVSATLALTIFLTGITILIFLRKKSEISISNIIHISSAILFFVPVFEFAFYTLKSPLPLVLSDIIIVIAIPWNIGIMVVAVLLNYFRK